MVIFLVIKNLSCGIDSKIWNLKFFIILYIAVYQLFVNWHNLRL